MEILRGLRKFAQRLALVGAFCLVFGAFALFAYKIYHKDDPEAYAAGKLLGSDKSIAQAFFSPDDKITDLLLALIEVERKAISIAIYTLTDKKITSALIRAHRRGVVVQLVVDPGYGNDRYSKIAQLAKEGIAIWVYQSEEDERSSSLMHNKFVLFDDNVEHHMLLWTGSFNFTLRAHERNQENVVILDNKHIIEQFKKQFGVLKKRSIQLSGQPNNDEEKPETKKQEPWWKSWGIF